MYIHNIYNYVYVYVYVHICTNIMASIYPLLRHRYGKWMKMNHLVRWSTSQFAFVYLYNIYIYIRNIHHLTCIMTTYNYHRIGWWENLQENPIFDGKNHGFRLKFSLKPIQWYIHYRILGEWDSTFDAARSRILFAIWWSWRVKSSTMIAKRLSRINFANILYKVWGFP